MSAVGLKTAGPVAGGANRQEGIQTLKAERSGRGKPAKVDPGDLYVLKGSKAQERRSQAHPGGRGGWLMS